ncbi:MAG: helix-turn-helix domain-containing protein [Bacteroidota bacterium]
MLRHISPSALSKISFLYNYHLNLLLFKDFSDRDVLIRALTNEFSLDLGSAKVDIIASILTVFLLKVQFQISHGFKPHRANSGKFLQFQKLVATKYMETRKASDYAIMLNMTYKQLNELCKELTKKTTKEYIDNYVVLEAKRLLAISNMSKVPIKKIAYECGFSETTNFLKFFKKIMGVTPAQFKAMRE